MPTIDGREYQHATMQVALASAQGTAAPIALLNFTKINYKTAAPKKPVRNAQGRIIGYTIDNSDNTGTIGTLLSEWRDFKRQILAQNAGQGIGTIALNATIQYGNNLAKLMTDQVLGLMFNEESRDSQNNQEAHVIEIPIFFIAAVYDVNGTANQFVNYDLQSLA